MVKIVKKFKTNMYKNDDENGGAMNASISAMTIGDIIIHSQTKKDGRLWGAVNPEKLLTLVEKNNGIYEVITNFSHKVYFDIDRHGEPDPLFLARILGIINMRFPNTEIAVSGSITSEKTSYHIVLSNYCIRNEHDREIMKQLVKKWAETEPAFDWKVYTKNRNMKCINQSKDDGRIQEIIENPDWKAHLITCFFSASQYPLPELPEELRLEVEVARARSAFDLSILPKMVLAVPSSHFDLEYASPTEILQLFPLNENFDHTYTHTIARYCYYSQMTLDQFLAWYENKCPLTPDRKAKWGNHWRNMTRFPPVSRAKVTSILKYYYPTITKPKYLLRFQNAFVLPQDKIQYIDRLSEDHFHAPFKAKIMNLGMGQGKTENTVKYIKILATQGHSIIWITPNIALARNTLNRIKQGGVEFFYYSDMKKSDKDAGKMADKNHLMICANSLHYTKTRTYHTVIIDEPETFLDKWDDGGFMDTRVKGTKKRNWLQLINIFSKAESIVFLDAFTSTKSISFLRNFVADDFVIFERPSTPITRTIEYIPIIPEYDIPFSPCLDMIFQDVKAGKKLFIYYPYKTPAKGRISMRQFHDELVAFSGKTGVFYNADQDESIKAGLQNVNEAWANVDFVIANSCITCGINYDSGRPFDECYLFFNNFSKPRDIIQVSARARVLTTKIIRLCFMERLGSEKVWVNDRDAMACPIYSQLYANTMIEHQAPHREAVHFLCAKAGYKQKTIKREIVRQLDVEHIEITNSDCSYHYQNIEPIGHETAEHIQNCIFSQCATMTEKYQLQRYFFDATFIPDTSPEMIGRAWNELPRQFIDKLTNVILDKDSFFHKIAEANGYPTVIISEGLLTRTKRAKIVIPPLAMTQIFNEFHFKYIHAGSQPIQILEAAFNKAFGTHVIKSKFDPEINHTDFSLAEDILEWEAFFKTHRNDLAFLNHPSLLSSLEK